MYIYYFGQRGLIDLITKTKIIHKSGGSLYIYLPKTFMEIKEIKSGDKVSISLADKNKPILIDKVRK
jgi:antitoxin component of MazEF toxin-antitoxin module